MRGDKQMNFQTALAALCTSCSRSMRKKKGRDEEEGNLFRPRSKHERSLETRLKRRDAPAVTTIPHRDKRQSYCELGLIRESRAIFCSQVRRRSW